MEEELETSEKTNEEQKPNSLLPYGKDELNLVDIRFSLLVKKPGNLREVPKTIEGKDFVVTGSDKYGLPFFFGDDVYIGLLAISKEQEFKAQKVNFSPWNLIDLMAWPHNGQSYARLELTLHQIAGVRIIHKKFWNAALEKLTKINFGLINNFELIPEKRGRKSGQQSLPLSWFEWNNAPFANFQNGYIKSLDIERYRRLTLPGSKRAYRWLDKRFYKQDEVIVDISEFGLDVIGLQNESYKHVSLLKQKIAQYIDELMSDKFIVEPIFRRAGNDREEIVFRKYKATTPCHTRPTSNDLLRKRLESFKNPAMNRTQIDFCVSSDNRDKTETALAILEQSIQQGRNIPNRPGYVYKLVKDGFKIPKGFQLKSQENTVNTSQSKKSREELIRELAGRIRSGEMKSFKCGDDKVYRIEYLHDEDPDVMKWSLEYYLETDGIYRRTVVFLRQFFNCDV